MSQEIEQLRDMDEELTKAEKSVDIMYVFRFTGIEPVIYLNICKKADRNGKYYAVASRIVLHNTPGQVQRIDRLM